jgi:hypothetical protein
MKTGLTDLCYDFFFTLANPTRPLATVATHATRFCHADGRCTRALTRTTRRTN